MVLHEVLYFSINSKKGFYAVSGFPLYKGSQIRSDRYAGFLKPSTNRYEVTKSTGIEIKGKKYDDTKLQTILLSHEFAYSTTTPALRDIIAADAGVIVH